MLNVVGSIKYTHNTDGPGIYVMFYEDEGGCFWQLAAPWSRSNRELHGPCASRAEAVRDAKQNISHRYNLVLLAFLEMLEERAVIPDWIQPPWRLE